MSQIGGNPRTKLRAGHYIRRRRCDILTGVTVRRLSTEQDLAVYDAWVCHAAHGSLWQSLQRKRYLEACGKEVRIYASEKAGAFRASALVVVDSTTGGLSTWEIPRGPLWTDESAVRELLQTILKEAKADRCIELCCSPGVPLPGDLGFGLSGRRVHASATRIIDLTAPESAILAQMHQKGRYNVTVAVKGGVTVRKGSPDDIDAFYALLKATGSRDGFKISQKSHYARFLDALEGSFILMASAAGKPVAGLIGVQWNGTGIYYYGASSYEHRSLMAPSLLQWEAIRLCKDKGCTRYDLLGISPDDAPYDDPWRGITDFKRKFGGTVVTYPPEQSIVFRPMMRTLLGWKRRILG